MPEKITSHMISTVMKPSAEGNLVKDCLLKVSEIVLFNENQCFAIRTHR